MQVFPPARENSPIRCPVCGGLFIDNGIRCAVMHAPGTCCHYGDTVVEEPPVPCIHEREKPAKCDHPASCRCRDGHTCPGIYDGGC